MAAIVNGRLTDLAHRARQQYQTSVELRLQVPTCINLLKIRSWKPWWIKRNAAGCPVGLWDGEKFWWVHCNLAGYPLHVGEGRKSWCVVYDDAGHPRFRPLRRSFPCSWHRHPRISPFRHSDHSCHVLNFSNLPEPCLVEWVRCITGFGDIKPSW